LDTLNYAIEKGAFHRDLNTAIPKPGKDPLEWANHRPVSLINTDLKIFSEVLARRREKVIGKIVSTDQTGFIKGRLVSDNICQLLHILITSNKIPPASGLLFLDAEKAFDCLEWHFLWRAMKEFKFGDEFKNMIQTLYNNPSARVCVGGGMSDVFDIRRGTRQGDTLSLLLFTLSIEPLAQLIRNFPTISPITVNSTSLSISLYVDDTLVYLANIQQTLPHAPTALDKFGYLSGYKVNISKSALMLLNTDQSEISLSSQINVGKEVLYLGVKNKGIPIICCKNELFRNSEKNTGGYE